MAKKKRKDDDMGFDNLKGFCQLGANVTSPGNIPTGHFLLDFAIQYGIDASKADLSKIDGYDPGKTVGIPMGKLVEIYGEEGSGKSSLAYRMAGYAQKLGYKVAWIDSEHSYQGTLASLNGCDTNQLIYANLLNHEDPDKVFHAEDVVNNMIKLMKQGVKLIVLDSVANLTPQALYEANSEQQFMGLLPRFLAQNLGKLVSHAEHNGALLVFINQIREKIGIQWGDPKTSPGGHSLHHNASLRLLMTKKNSKDADIYVPDPENGEPMLIGRHSLVRLKKNRFAKPFMDSLEIPIYYEAYFPEIEDVAFDTGRQMRLISIRKGFFKWGDMKEPIEGRDAFINYVKANGLIDRLVEDIKVQADENNVILPPEIVQYNSENTGE